LIEKQGIVIKSVGGVFTVYGADKQKTVCFSPKKLRYNREDVCVGDRVTFFVLSKGKGTITDVLPRKNKLTRPEIANVDVAFVVVAPLPETDFLLVDKIIVNCFKSSVEPVVVVNKSDVASEEYVEKVKSSYRDVCDVVVVSCKEGDVSALEKYIDDKIVCFAGQSAVGKTSILNRLVPGLNKQVGDLSEKTQRGMHTTRHSQIFPVLGGYVVDTSGFSALEVTDVESSQLMLYYDDMMALSPKCKYNMCTHVAEPDCAVKQAVAEGKFDKDRYERYKMLYGELRESEKEKYQ